MTLTYEETSFTLKIERKILSFINVLIEIKYSKCVRHICRKFLIFLKTLKCLVFADMSAAIQVSVRKVTKKSHHLSQRR